MNGIGTVTLILFYVVVTAFILAGRSENAPPGRRFFPRTLGDALSLLFHLLEFMVFTGIMAFWIGNPYGDRTALVPLAMVAGGGAAALLVILSLVCWGYDRALARAGLLWGGIPIAFLSIMVVSVGR